LHASSSQVSVCSSVSGGVDSVDKSLADLAKHITSRF
jgi:hypothetical protein